MNKILALFIICSAALGFANPIKIEGLYAQTGEILKLIQVTQQIVYTNDVVKKLIEDGYGCNRLGSKFKCVKTESITELPDEVVKQLLLKAPQSVYFESSDSNYSLVHESETYFEWHLPQKSLIDGIEFSDSYWLQIQVTTEKILVKNSVNSRELIWFGNGNLGSMESHTKIDSKTATTINYWGQVVYTRKN